MFLSFLYIFFYILLFELEKSLLRFRAAIL